MSDSPDFYISEIRGDSFTDFCVHTARYSGNRLHKVGRLEKIGQWDHGITNRTQYVKYKNCNSERNIIKCGVPQGSILGSLLFIIYINDIHLSSIKGNFITFADDTNVIYAGKHLNDLTISVNEELEKIYNWLSANKLFLNINKTNT